MFKNDQGCNVSVVPSGGVGPSYSGVAGGGYTGKRNEGAGTISLTKVMREHFCWVISLVDLVFFFVFVLQDTPGLDRNVRSLILTYMLMHTWFVMMCHIVFFLFSVFLLSVLLDIHESKHHPKKNKHLYLPAPAQKAAKYAAMQALLGTGGYRGRNHTGNN